MQNTGKDRKCHTTSKLTLDWEETGIWLEGKRQNNFTIPGTEIKTWRTACAVSLSCCPKSPTWRGGLSDAWRAFKGGQSPRRTRWWPQGCTPRWGVGGRLPPAQRRGTRATIWKRTTMENSKESRGRTAWHYTHGRCHLWGHGAFSSCRDRSLTPLQPPNPVQRHISRHTGTLSLISFFATSLS